MLHRRVKGTVGSGAPGGSEASSPATQPLATTATVAKPVLDMAHASPYTVSRNPGPGQSKYIEAEVMPSVATALTAILEKHPSNPVFEFTSQLREMHRLRSLGDAAEDAAAHVVMPILLDSSATASADLRPSTATPAEATTVVRSRHEVGFRSRPTRMESHRMHPQRLQRSGHHPVFGLDLPLSKDLSSTVRHIQAETGAQRFHWIIVGTGDLQLYLAGKPYRGVPSGAQWNNLRRRVDPAECPEAASGSRCLFGASINRAKLHDMMEAEALRSIHGSMRAIEAAESRRNASRAREAYAGVADGAPPAEVLLRVTEDDGSATPVSPSKRYIFPLRQMQSVSATIRTATADVQGIEHTFVRLQHPDDVVVNAAFCDDVTKACDAAFGTRAPTTGNVAVIVCGVDRWSLVKHVQSLVTLYSVVSAELHHIKRLCNVAPSSSSGSPQAFVRAVALDVQKRRRQRDERREWLVKAHVQGVYDSKGDSSAYSSAIATDTANLFEKRTGLKQQRNQRRRREDDRRAEVFLEQSLDAARCIQKAVRSYFARRRKQENAIQTSNTIFAPRQISKSLSEVDVMSNRKVLLATYAEGEFPIIRRLHDSLIETFGPEFLTHQPPQTGAAKAYRQYLVRYRRLEPVDDLDASSEEEEWDSQMSERIRTIVQTSFNPLFNAQVAHKFAKGTDLAEMSDMFANYSGLASMQRKGLIAMERFGMLVQYAAYLSFHHKRRVGADYGGILLTPLQSQLFRLPAKLQSVNTFAHFCKVHAGGQSLLVNASWLTPFLVQQPSLLHPASSTRLLVSGPTPTGSYYHLPVQAPDGPAPKSPGVDLLQSLHAKTNIFMAPEHVSVDQWTDVVAAVFKRANGVRRVLWLSTRPEFIVYANDVPLVVTSRPELVAHDSALPKYSTFHTANINGSKPPVYVYDQGPLSIPGGEYVRRTALGAGSRRSSRELNARDMALRSPTPLAEAPPDTAGSISHVTKRQGNPHGTKDTPLPNAWLGVNWDHVERELCAELVELVEQKDGRLVTFTATGMQAGPHVPVSFAHTALSDRPSNVQVVDAVVEKDVEPDPIPPHTADGQPSPSSHAPSQAVISATPSRLPSTSNLLAHRHGGGAAAGGSKPLLTPMDSAMIPISSASTPRQQALPPMMVASLPQSPLAAAAVYGQHLLPASTTHTAAGTTTGIEAPPREDGPVILRKHEIQITRPRRQYAKHNALHGDDSPDAKDVMASKMSMDNLSNAGDDRESVTMSIFNHPARGGIGQVDRPSIARNRSHDTASTAITRKTLRNVQNNTNANKVLQRQQSITSAGVAEALLVEEMDEATARLPARAADAFATPWQAADEVRLRLKRRYGLDSALTYRRAPMLRTNGPDWLRGIDQIYRLALEQLQDPYLAIVVGVSDPDSVFITTLFGIVFALDVGKSTMLGVPESSQQQNDWNGNHTQHFLASSFGGTYGGGRTAGGGVGTNAATNALMEFATEAARHSPFGIVNRLVEENVKAEMHESLKFVDVLLSQTGLRDALFAPIEHFMRLAEMEAAKLPPNPTLLDTQLVMWFANQASRALERYVLLILFHHFVKFVVERRAAMSVMQVDFSFAEHIETMPHVAELLDHLDPWEGASEQSPVSPFTALLSSDARWRRRTWVATIG